MNFGLKKRKTKRNVFFSLFYKYVCYECYDILRFVSILYISPFKFQISNIEFCLCDWKCSLTNFSSFFILMSFWNFGYWIITQNTKHRSKNVAA